MEAFIWKGFPFLLHILIFSAGLTTSQPDFLYKFCIESSGNYTNNGPYQTNLNSTLSSLLSNTNEYGFNSSSLGENPNRANALVLCRGDIGIETCRSCINDATAKLTQLCPNYKEAIGWYDYCMLRYSNKSINGTLAISPSFYMWNVNNVTTDHEQFNQAILRALLEDLFIQAADGGDHQKFSTNSIKGLANYTIYALTQCTPDLSRKQCGECLDNAIGGLSGCCNGKQGGRIILPSCYFRFETYPFSNSTPADVVPSAYVAPPTYVAPSTPAEKDDNQRAQIIIIVVASITGFLIAFILCICFFLRKRKPRNPRHRFQTVDTTSDGDMRTVESLQYDFVTISTATNNFSDDNKLGQGGFGVVYKGKLPNGQEIAVKRLSQNSGQGEQEFKNEVMLVAKLQHRNLVRLLGFSFEGIERLLIYEFMTNASLDQYIFNSIKRVLLNWDKRYKIINGIAKGLLYLHEDSRLRIIHRDLKASNVLLDDDMNAKISDFGMARLFVMDETEGSTNRIVGTYGYMAPEYAMYGHFSVKSDVFSFGVLILEILSGQKNSYFRTDNTIEDLLSYAWKSWREGTAPNLIDPMLRSSSGSTREMMRCIHVGLLCVQENIVERPTMAAVVPMLSRLSLDLPIPSHPAFFLEEHISGVTDQSNKSRKKSSSVSYNEASITELYPR